MGRGGKRQGAGRKRNSPNRASQQRQAEVAASGATPLDVMLADMRFHHELAEQEAKKRGKADNETIGRHRAAAREAAKDAAPFVHPRLASVQHMGKGGGPIQHLDLSRLTDEQLASLEGIFGSLAGAGDDAGIDPGGEGAPGS